MFWLPAKDLHSLTVGLYYTDDPKKINKHTQIINNPTSQEFYSIYAQGTTNWPQLSEYNQKLTVLSQLLQSEA